MISIWLATYSAFSSASFKEVSSLLQAVTISSFSSGVSIAFRSRDRQEDNAMDLPFRIEKKDRFRTIGYRLQTGLLRSG